MTKGIIGKRVDLERTYTTHLYTQARKKAARQGSSNPPKSRGSLFHTAGIGTAAFMATAAFVQFNPYSPISGVLPATPTKSTLIVEPKPGSNGSSLMLVAGSLNALILGR